VHPFSSGILAASTRWTVWAQMEILLPLYRYPYSDFQVEAPMWVQVKEAAEAGHHVTGIVNPLNGPNVEGNDLALYTTILNDFFNKGDNRTDPAADFASLTLICYVSTDYGNKDEAAVLADVDMYEENFPGVCDGIFFDEAFADITDNSGNLDDYGDLYQSYSQYATAKTDADGQALDWTVTFNPGTGADPRYLSLPGEPTVMSFENYYDVLKSAGMPRIPLSSAESSQHAIAVHSTVPDLDGETAETHELLQAIVQAAACAGWGKIYITSDTQKPNDAENPWNEITNYWDGLVDAVAMHETIPPENCPDPRMTLTVPLWTALTNSEAEFADAVQDVLDVVSKADFLDGAVSAVFDARSHTAEARDLREAGARIVCYFDFSNYNDVFGLTDDLASASTVLKEVCGGFYVDKYFEIAGFAESNVYVLYENIQGLVPGSTLFIAYADADIEPEFNLYTKDWTEVSFLNGRVVVVKSVDAAAALPDLDADAGETALNSALLVTGFTETTTEAQEVECLLTDMKASRGYGFITGVAGVLDPSATYYLARLLAEVDEPTITSDSCDDLQVTVTPACGADEDEATISWSSGSRKIFVRGGGCADMARIAAFLTTQGLAAAGFPLLEVTPGVWELDASIDVRAGSILKVIGEEGEVGEDGIGECNELRLLSDATNGRRTRLLGNSGSILIQNTKIVGWNRADEAPDMVESSSRGYIFCSSTCSGTSTAQCEMSVVDSEIQHLGSGGVTTSGLAWRNRCDFAAPAAANGLTLTGNRRGFYAFGVNLDIVGLDVKGSGTEGIRLDTCSGHVKDSTVDQEDSASWGFHVQRPDGLEISGNEITGSRSLLLANDLAGGASPTITGNTIVTPALVSVRIRTTNTEYSGNTGDGRCAGCSRIGLAVQQGGCFTTSSGSDDDSEVDAYITSRNC
ncbi:unnamed protein product, partial [Scytosiphon promiscuus]